MLKVTLCRPNTIGVYLTKTFEDYNEAESYIELRCEKLADRDWELSELPNCSSESGVIECTHDYQADIILIEWQTVKVAEYD